MAIHPTAIIDKTAEIDPSAEIGAYAVVERQVRIGAEAKLYPHAYVAEGTTLGRRCQIHPFAVVGHQPQDTKWTGAQSFLRIGDDTVVREQASLHRGTLPGSTTTIGARCYLMATAHVGHNCTVGDNVTIANGAMLAGHVEIGARAFISGNAVLHQFTRIGELAMIGGNSSVGQDIPPFMLVRFPQVILGPNVIGLRRAGMGAADRHEVREFYRVLYRSGLAFPKAVEQLAQHAKTDAGRRIVEFLRSPSKRGFMTYRAWGGTRDVDSGEET